MNRRFVACIMACAVASIAPVCARARPWTLRDVFAFSSIDTVEVSKTNQVLFSVERADVARDAVITTYYILYANGSIRPVEQKIPMLQAHWSPTGAEIAFTSPAKDGAIALFTVRPDGRALRRLTTSSRSIVGFAWSPRGERIAAIETAPVRHAKPPLSLWFEPDTDVLADQPAKRDLWIVDAHTGRERQVTRDTYSYGGPATDHDPNWAPTGDRVAVVRQPTPYYDAYERQEFVSVDVRTGRTQPLTGHVDALPASAPPQYSSEGRVVTVHTWDGTFAAREDVYVDNTDVTAALDRDFWSCSSTQVAWAGSNVLATAQDGVAVRLYRLGLRTEAAPLTPDTGAVTAFSPAPDGSIVYAYSTPTQPPELFRLFLDGTRKQLTHLNPRRSGLDIAPTSVVHWTNAQGHVLVGQLTGSADPSRVLLTEVHGGPQCAYSASFDPLTQYFASNGYAYFLPNPRGSDGYGDWSYKAIVGDWAAGPTDDVLRGVDAVRAQDGFGDAKLYLYGASYGGYLTSWIVTHDARFRAAVAAIPVTDLTLEYTLSQSPNILRRFFGQRPVAEHPQLLAEQSPLRYAKDETTPLLLIAGLHDVQAPYPQTIAFYKVLQEDGKDVRLLAYPNEGHGFSAPSDLVDWMKHITGWFAAHGGPSVPGAILP